MGSVYSERDILRKQIHNDVVETLGRRQRPNHPPPQQMLATVLACYALGRQKARPPAAIAAEFFHNDAALLTALARPGWIGKSAQSPAQTTVAGWAAELTTATNFDTLQILAPASIYAQLSSHPGAIRVSLAGRGSVRIPSRLPAPSLAPAFIGEGQPIPVRIAMLSSALLVPRKAAVVSMITQQMLAHSTPSIAGVIRDVMSFDASIAIDGVLLDANPATTVRPAGILNGVVATGATTGGGLSAFASDIRNLAAAIESSGAMAYPTLIMSSTSELMIDTLSMSATDTLPILSSPNVPQKQLIMVDAANFCSGEGDEPFIDTTNEAMLNMEDTTPLPIVGGTVQPPAIGSIAAPVASAWQTNCVALRMIQDCSWTMTRPGRVSFVSSVSW